MNKIFNLIAWDLGHLLKSGALVSLANILSTVLGLLFSVYVARTYGAHATGLLALISSVLTFSYVISSLGIHTSILRMIPEHEQLYSSLSSLYLMRRIIIILFISASSTAAALYLLSGFIVDIFANITEFSPALRLIAPFLVIIVISKFFIQSLRAFHSVKIFSVFIVLDPLIKLLSIYLLTSISIKLINPVIAMLVSPCVLIITAYVAVHMLCNKHIVLDSRTLVHNTPTIDIIKLSMPMLLTTIMHIIISEIDTIMLGIYVSTEEVGIYSVAYKISVFASFFLGAFNSILAPQYSKLHASGDKIGLRKLAQRSTRVICLISFPICLALYIAGENILAFFGQEFIAGYSVLMILVAGQMINLAAGSVGYFLNMTGNQVPFNMIITASGILNIGLNLLLIPRYGMIGAAWASMVSLIVWNILATVLTKLKYSYTISIISSGKLS